MHDNRAHQALSKTLASLALSLTKYLTYTQIRAD